jgi:thioredoxin 1
MQNKPTADSGFHAILKNENLVLVDFFAEWCGPCQMMKPILSEVKSRMGDKVRILKVDVDKNPEISQAMEIMSIPTLALFQKGKMVWRKTGIMQTPQLCELINQYSNA